MYQGWSVQGIWHFNELYDLVANEHTSKLGKDFDKNLLESCQEKRNESKRAKPKKFIEFELCCHDLWTNAAIISKPVSGLVGPVSLENDSANEFNYQLGNDDNNDNASSVVIKETVAV